MPLGNVDIWTIRNDDDELHNFHIHQSDFQVLEINGEPVEFTGLRDTITLPIRSEVKVVIPFDDPVQLGGFVYHCHVLDHEDKGMMQIVVVYDSNDKTAGPLPDWVEAFNDALNIVGFDMADLSLDTLSVLIGDQAAHEYVLQTEICAVPL